MKKILLSLVALLLITSGIFIFNNQKIEPKTGTSTPVETPAENPVQTVQNKQASIGLNEPAVFNGITLTAWAVTEDSRCASDVQCIWAGRVLVAIRVDSPSGASSIFELEPGKTITVPNAAITLDSVSPYPVSTHKTGDGEYLFSFTFKKL